MQVHLSQTGMQLQLGSDPLYGVDHKKMSQFSPLEKTSLDKIALAIG